jgi:hypothetical protein
MAIKGLVLLPVEVVQEGQRVGLRIAVLISNLLVVRMNQYRLVEEALLRLGAQQVVDQHQEVLQAETRVLSLSVRVVCIQGIVHRDAVMDRLENA